METFARACWSTFKKGEKQVKRKRHHRKHRGPGRIRYHRKLYSLAKLKKCIGKIRALKLWKRRKGK